MEPRQEEQHLPNPSTLPRGTLQTQGRRGAGAASPQLKAVKAVGSHSLQQRVSTEQNPPPSLPVPAEGAQSPAQAGMPGAGQGTGL